MTDQIEKLRKENEFIFALAGNPNVGKSTIFSSLTSMYVETANYPGKTVGLNIASTVMNEIKIGLVDLPGAYSLGAVTDDQWVARQAVLEGGFDAVIYIADATNLTRNLYMLLQLIDMGLPVVVALNLVDEAKRQGIYIDVMKLSRILGAPVVETVGVRGIGLEKLVSEAIKVAKFADDTVGRTFRCAKVSKQPSVIKPAEDTEETIKKRMARAEKISQDCQIVSIQFRYKETKLFNVLTHPFWGLVVFLLVLSSIFAILYFAGSFLSGEISAFWNGFISPYLNEFFISVFGAFIGKLFIFAFNEGILAALTIGVPYVFVFYFMLAFLEDTGYLNIVAFLVDKLMHKVGLHGRASILLIAGMGCNVPAIMGIKVLKGAREKTLAALLITLIPCSARNAVIMGSVSLFVGPFWALSIFLITFAVMFTSGYFLNKILKGKPYGLVMEISDLRAPGLKVIFIKTWHRFKDFVFVATPIILVGSFILGILYQTGAIWYFAKPFKPVIEGMLGLPAIAGLTLVFAVLRKELALVFLVTLAAAQAGAGSYCNATGGHIGPSLLNFMTKQQIYVFALVNTLYIPCLATIGVLAKEIGVKRTIYITIATISIAVIAGTIARFIVNP